MAVRSKDEVRSDETQVHVNDERGRVARLDGSEQDEHVSYTEFNGF